MKPTKHCNDTIHYHMSHKRPSESHILSPSVLCAQEQRIMGLFPGCWSSAEQ